jgi:hypothetical protein
MRDYISIPIWAFHQVVSDLEDDLDWERDEDSLIPVWLENHLISVHDFACLDLTAFHLSLSSHVSETDFQADYDHCGPCNYTFSGAVGELWIALTDTVRESASARIVSSLP